MDLVELTAGDKDNKYVRAALVLRTVGWLSIIWGLMISIYIWMGQNAGSQLWLWWSIGQLALGAVLLAIAARLKAHSGQAFGVPETNRRDRAA